MNMTKQAELPRRLLLWVIGTLTSILPLASSLLKLILSAISAPMLTMPMVLWRLKLTGMATPLPTATMSKTI
jgi:hypothetical protein